MKSCKRIAGAENIKWDKSIDEGIAIRLAKHWKEWQGGNKTQSCRLWAAELGIKLDPKGLRTKGYIITVMERR